MTNDQRRFMATLATATEKKSGMSVEEKHERKPHRGRVDDKFRIFCGTANQPLADEVCAFLGMTRGQALVRRFADGEAYVQIQENVRGADVFVMQPTCRPVDQHLMELLLMIDALKRASARRITAVIPYYGYGRQDRKDKPRAPISAKLVADLLTTAGADRALIIDPHAPQIQGFFNIPVDPLFASPVLVDYFKKLNLPNLTEVMHVIGDVQGRTCLVIDDLIDTAGTLVKTATALVENGATAVYACCSHPVLSGSAVENIAQSCIKEVVVTDTIPLTEEAKKEPKIVVRSVAGLIGRAIQSIHEETSVSKLFI